MKTPDQNEFKLRILDSLSKTSDFGFKRSSVKGTGSSFSTFSTRFVSVEWMQLQSSIFVHKCTISGYYLRIKNYAGMQRVS